MPNKDIEVRWVSVDDIVPLENNPNKHTPEQIERIARNLRYQGFRSALIVSNLSGRLVAGNGRLEAAKLNGWDKVPVSLQHFDDQAQEEAFIVADNALKEGSTLDLAQVNFMMLDLGPDFDPDLMGLPKFTIDPSEKLTANEEKKKQKNCPHCGEEI